MIEINKILVGEYAASDGETYEVTVTYGLEAGIPEGAALEVSEIGMESEAYAEYVQRTAQTLGKSPDQLPYVKLLDISIVKDGAEIEPLSPVDVRITLRDYDGALAAAGQAGESQESGGGMPGSGEGMDSAAPPAWKIWEEPDEESMVAGILRAGVVPADEGEGGSDTALPEGQEEGEKGGSIEVVHLGEGEAEVLDNTASEEGGGNYAVRFQTPSFSIYAVTVVDDGETRREAVADVGSFIQDFKAGIVYGVNKEAPGTAEGKDGAVYDSYVWTAPNPDAGHRFNFQIDLYPRAITETKGLEFAPRTVEIRIPKSILRDKEGKQADSYEMSVPSEDEVAEAAANSEALENDVGFAYREEGDELVLYNYCALGNDSGQRYIIQMSYIMEKTSFYYQDMAPSAPFTAKLSARYPEAPASTGEGEEGTEGEGENAEGTDGTPDGEGSGTGGGGSGGAGEGEPGSTGGSDAPSYYLEERELDRGIVVRIDTQVNLISAKQEELPVMYDTWQASWGTAAKPDKPEEYLYYVWEVRSQLNDNSQAYGIQIEDAFEAVAKKDGIEAEDAASHIRILGCRFSGDSGFATANVKSPQTARGTRYDYVLMALDKSFWQTQDYWKITNRVSVTVTPLDGADAPKTVYNERAFSWNVPTVPIGGGGNAYAFVRADGWYRNGVYPRTYLAEIGMRAGTYSRYDLGNLVGGENATKTTDALDGLDYAVRMYGYPMQWTIGEGADKTVPDNYFQKDVRYSVTNEEFYVFDEQDGFSFGGGEGSEEGSGQAALRLDASDYQIDSIAFRLECRDKAYNEYTGDFDKDAATAYAEGEALVFYGKFGTGADYVQIASFKAGTRSWIDYNETYIDRNKSSNTKLVFKDGAQCTAYKAETTNRHFYTCIDTVPSISIKYAAGSNNHIFQRVTLQDTEGGRKATDSIGIADAAQFAIYDYRSGETPVWSYDSKADAREGIDYVRTVSKASSLEKKVLATSNEAKNRRYVITWGVEAKETVLEGAGDRSPVEQSGGAFYDLLPLGAGLDPDSVVLSNEEGRMAQSEFEIEQFPNYKSSGQTLLKVSISGRGSWYTLYYNTVHTYDSIKDYGSKVYNAIAYRTDNPDIGGGQPDKGGNLRKAELMSGLDGGPADESSRRYIFAEHDYDIIAIMSAASGISKKVKSAGSSSYGNEAKVNTGSAYSYQLRFQNAGSKAKDIIFYDPLENEKPGGVAGQWQGRLQAIDFSAIDKKGVSPEVYIITKETAEKMSEKAAGEQQGGGEGKAEGEGQTERAGEDAGIGTFSMDEGNSGEWVLSDGTKGAAGSGKLWEKVENPGSAASFKDAWAVAIDLSKTESGGAFVLPEDDSLTVVLHMESPETEDGIKIPEPKPAYPKAYNNFLVGKTIVPDGAPDIKDGIHASSRATTVELALAKDIRVRKLSDPDRIGIGGISFKLYGTSAYGYGVEKTAYSDKNGYLVFKDVERGDESGYTLYEYESTPDWIRSRDEHKVSITKDGMALIDYDEATVLAEAREALSAGGGENAGNGPTEAEVAAKAAEIRDEQYDYAPKGRYFEVMDKPRLHSDVVFFKARTLSSEKDSRKIPVPGTVFSLRGTSAYGNMVDQTASANAQGLVVFQDIEAGNDYTLRELVANGDYALPDTQYRVKVSGTSNSSMAVTIEERVVTGAGGEEKVTYELVDHDNANSIIYNYPKYWDVPIKKVDAGNLSRTLQGAVLRLYGATLGSYAYTPEGAESAVLPEQEEDGTPYLELTSGADGMAVFRHLAPGSYILREAEAPKMVDGLGRAGKGSLNYVGDMEGHILTISDKGEVEIEGLSEDAATGAFLFPNERANSGQIIIYKKWEDNGVGNKDRPVPEIRLTAVNPDEAVKLDKITVNVEWVGDAETIRQGAVEVELYKAGSGGTAPVLVASSDKPDEASGNIWSYSFSRDSAGDLLVMDGSISYYACEPRCPDNYVSSNPDKDQMALVEGGSATIYNAYNEVTNYGYTGERQQFTAQYAGEYQFEAWGAQGYDSMGGKGGYTKGTVHLDAGQTVYIYVGECPVPSEEYIDLYHEYEEKNLITNGTLASTPGGWNGGGAGTYYNQKGFGGGGATDFRLLASRAEDGWSGMDSLESRIMVAAGGGAGAKKDSKYWAGENGYKGGAGGGLTGLQGNSAGGNLPATGGTQSAGGKAVRQPNLNTVLAGFGRGGDGSYMQYGGQGGGGGWYGGGGSNRRHDAGGGGSSYINGYAGCDTSYRNEKFLFKDTEMIDGDHTITEPGGKSGKGHSGDGYARITLVSIDADGEADAGKSGGNSGGGTSGSGNSGTVSPKASYVSNADGWEKTGDTWKYVFKVFNEKTAYTATEILEEGSDYKTVGESTIMIDGSVQNYATFTNRKEAAYGSLCIEKAVTGIESAQPFDFTLTLTGSNGQFSGRKTIGGMVFEDGKASFSLSAGQERWIRDIPEGTGYSIQEEENGNFTTSYSIDGGAAAEGRTAVGTITENKVSTVLFTNTYKPVDRKTVGITVRQLVTGALEGEADARYTVIAVFENLEKNLGYAYTVQSAEGVREEGGEAAGQKLSFTTDGEGRGIVRLQLRHGESAVFHGIQENARYTFTEDAGDWSSSYEITNTGNAGSIRQNAGSAGRNASLSTAQETAEADEKITVTFTNRLENFQTLRVSKRLSMREGFAAPAGEEFAFSISFKDLGEFYSFNSGIGVISADYKGETAAKEFKLKAGESVLFEELPAGARYTVKEAASNYAASYKMSAEMEQEGKSPSFASGSSSGTVRAELSTDWETVDRYENAAIEFTNNQGFVPLTVRNEVAGNAGRKGDVFQYTLHVPAAAGRSLGIGDAGEAALAFDGNGNASFRLGDAESITVWIPYGGNYTVTESGVEVEKQGAEGGAGYESSTPEEERYSASYSYNGGSAAMGYVASGSMGTEAAGLTFTNTRTAVRFVKADKELYNQYIDAIGDGGTGAGAGNADAASYRLGGAVFSLNRSDGQSYAAYSGQDAWKDGMQGSGMQEELLLAGDYELVENRAPDGYLILNRGVYFKLDSGGTVSLDSATAADGYAALLPEELAGGGTMYTVVVKNSPGQSLPSTGGTGTRPYRLAGLLLLACSAGYALRSSHRGRRRKP